MLISKEARAITGGPIGDQSAIRVRPDSYRTPPVTTLAYCALPALIFGFRMYIYTRHTTTPRSRGVSTPLRLVIVAAVALEDLNACLKMQHD